MDICDIEYINDSNNSDSTFLLGQLESEPNELNKAVYEKAQKPFLCKRKRKRNDDDNESTIDNSVWKEIKKKTDSIKKKVRVKEKQYKAKVRKLVRKKALVNAKLKRFIIRRKIELKRKKKRRINKAYYIKGQLYRQPKLPTPQKWVTRRLYTYLWKCMKSKFKTNTRVESEKFIMKMSDIVTIIIRRKTYNNYKCHLDSLLHMMAKLNIIRTRFDFYRFCSEYMPYKFRVKVMPISIPGNIRNIPYQPELINKPILNNRKNKN